MNTINIQQFIAMCNDYIADSSANSLSAFLLGTGYMQPTSNGIIFSSNIAISADKVNNAKLNIPASFAASQDGKTKIKEMVEFVAYHAQEITDTEVTNKNEFVCNLATALSTERTTINIEKNAYDTLASSDFQLYNPQMSIPKSHPKRSFWIKRVGIPAAVAAGIAGITYGILSATPIASNSSYFSPDSWASFAQWTSNAAVVAAAGSAGFTLISKAITRAHYKKYCQNGKNIESIVNGGDVESLTQLYNNDLPLKLRELMTKLRKSNSKIIRLKEGNWFQRNIACYFQRKMHRNQLWALASYAEYLREYMSKLEENKESTLPAVPKAVQLLMSYIDSNVSLDIRDNFEASSDPYLKLENIDIYSTIARGLAKKDDLSKVKSECYKLMSKLTLDRFKTTADSAMLGLVRTLPEVELPEVADSETPLTSDSDKPSEDAPKTNNQTQPQSNITKNPTPVTTSTQRKSVTRTALERLKVTAYKKKYTLAFTSADGDKRNLEIARTGDAATDNVALGAAVQKIMGAEAVQIKNTDLDTVVDNQEESQNEQQVNI